MNQQFPKRLRLRKQADFDAVYNRSVHAADGVLVIQAQFNDLGYTRLGLSIGKRVGDSPTRSRWKRTIREVFRKANEELPQGFDIIVRPRKGAVLSYAAVERSLPMLIGRVAKKLRRDQKKKAQQATQKDSSQ